MTAEAPPHPRAAWARFELARIIRERPEPHIRAGCLVIFARAEREVARLEAAARGGAGLEAALARALALAGEGASA